jgi:hypothetical protein
VAVVSLEKNELKIESINRHCGQAGQVGGGDGGLYSAHRKRRKYRIGGDNQIILLIVN